LKQQISFFLFFNLTVLICGKRCWFASISGITLEDSTELKLYIIKYQSIPLFKTQLLQLSIIQKICEMVCYANFFF